MRRQPLFPPRRNWFAGEVTIAWQLRKRPQLYDVRTASRSCRTAKQTLVGSNPSLSTAERSPPAFSLSLRATRCRAARPKMIPV